MKVDNLYKQGLKRTLVEKQISYDYFSCKHWLGERIWRTSMAAREFNSLTLIVEL
jgi:hypothetical protein|tara:strand:+ start:4250 stop:4414 length:165 start_codon:yes stop_codon:yes gene_type:complete